MSGAGTPVDYYVDAFAPAVVQVPAEALVMRGEKATVAVIDDGAVHYRPVLLADDDGHTARVASGLKAGERVALNLGAEVDEGTTVQLAEDGARAMRRRSGPTGPTP